MTKVYNIKYKITEIKQNWLFMGFQETANAVELEILRYFAALIKFANFIENRFEFDDIMLIYFATDGQDVLVKNSLLKPIYKGQTNKMWNSDSTFPIEQRRQILTSMWRPRSISKLYALRRKAASSERNLSFKMHSTYFSVLNWQCYANLEALLIKAYYQFWVKWSLIRFVISS